LNGVKATAFPWMLEVSKAAPQQAIKNVGTAFKNFFEGRAKYPKFKKKGKSHDSFRADNGPTKEEPNAVKVDGKRVKLPVIGWIRMREKLRFKGNIKSATVSRVADRCSSASASRSITLRLSVKTKRLVVWISA
jgi:putative transposase